MKDLEKYIVKSSSNIRTAIKQMDKGGMGFIIIVDKDEKVIGVVTDGDFRRAILSGVHLKENILLITNKNYKYLIKGYSQKEALNFFKGKIVEFMPVLENGKLVEIISKDDLYNQFDIELPKKQNLDLPVVIMAGGKGNRLDPFTRILPKALIPIGKKPVVELIMDEFAKYSITDFYMSVNYKDKMIKAYFEGYSSDYKITYIEEDEPLGTAGALKFLEGKFDGPFFISNCDIIIKSDYSDIVKFHEDKKDDLTLVGSMQHHRIPYGVCTFESGGLLKNIQEKPEYDFLVNTGMYILNSHILSYIPVNTYFNMTELINTLQKKAHKVSVYPVSEKSWIDVGQWQEYKKSLKQFYNND